MNTSKQQNLVITTGFVMTGVTLFEEKGKLAGIAKTQNNNQTQGVARKLLAIWLFVIVTAVMSDYAPSFTTPFTLLVLVIFLTKKAPVISGYFNNTTGKKK